MSHQSQTQLPQPQPSRLLASSEVAALLRGFLKPLSTLKPSIRQDRMTGNLYVSLKAGRLPPAQQLRLALLIQTFSGSRFDPYSGSFDPVDKYFPGIPTPFRLAPRLVALHGPATDTPHVQFDISRELEALEKSSQLPWLLPRPLA